MNLFNRKRHFNLIYRLLSPALALFLIVTPIASLQSYAVDYEEQALLQKELPIQSNETPQWPHGPEITAEAAIVMEANTGTILYAKNIHEELYPASTTKIMTCLLAVENASLSDEVKFSNEAVFSVPKGGSNIGMDVGQSITLEQALYGILVGSANEVANAVGELVGGTIEGFVDMMNDRAKELGCTNTHFANTNGLQDENHYTSVYDLALISKAFFSNEFLCKVGNTPRYHFTPTATQPDDFYLNNKHKLISGEIAYEGILGGKTGYTDLARETLVTCAEKDSLKLICIVFKDESPSQFTDTVTLFDYGFNNFQSVNVKDEELRYMPDDSLFFESDNDVFGKSGTILKLDRDSRIILPKTSSVEDTSYEFVYDLTEEEKSKRPDAIARVDYSFNGVPIGKAYICYNKVTETKGTDAPASSRTMYVNVIHLFIFALAVLVLFTVIGLIISAITDHRRPSSRSDRLRYNRRRKEFKQKKIKF